MSVTKLLQTYAGRVERALDACMPAPSQDPVTLHEAMRYATLNGGKRVRAGLVYATGDALGASPDELDTAACAVELIHAFSLVHDDLPSMDNDDLRRGRPTCHKQYDEATALLVGDALQTMAFEILSRDIGDGETIAARLAMVQTLAIASGSRGMAGGQALDIEATGRTLTLEQLVQVHQLKTGALIHASVRLGALAARSLAPEVDEKLDEFGRSIGLAFQIVDDILDVTADTTTLGKPQGSDQAANKATFPVVMGLDQARERADTLLKSALATLAPLGDNGRTLAEIAGFIVHRHY
jgi:geranylgeranyl pyrophosphate synthase